MPEALYGAWIRIRDFHLRNWTGFILGIGVMVGLILVFSYRTFSHATETVEFCVSCHVMNATMWEDYSKSSHFKNSSGVQASCADCHVPASFLEYMSVKLSGSRMIYRVLTGHADETLENFEKNKAHMVEKVWDLLRRTDSSPCRSCHNEVEWDLAAQTTRAREQHKSALEERKTCIDCHDNGLVHERIIVERPADELGEEVDFVF